MWFGAALRQGANAAKRAGFAVTKRVRASLGKVEGADAITDEESKGGSSRAWLGVVEEAFSKVRNLLDKSTFVRIGRVEGWIRKKLGLPPRIPRALPAATKRAAWSPGNGPRNLPSKAPTPLDAEAAARYRSQVQTMRTQVNTGRGSIPTLPPTDEPK